MTNVTERFTAVYNFLTVTVIFVPRIMFYFLKETLFFSSLSKLCISAEGYNSLQETRILLGLCSVVYKSIFSCVNHHVFLF